MSSKLKFFSILTLGAVFAVGSTAVFAQEGKATAPATTEQADKAGKHGKRGGHGHHKAGKGGFGRHRGGMFRMMEGLNLTDAQKSQFKAIREANKPDQAVMSELKAIREARKAGTELTADQKARVTALREQMHAKRKLVHEQIQNVFTAEQKALIQQRKLEMKTRMDQFKQNRELRRKQKPAETTTTEKPAA